MVNETTTTQDSKVQVDTIDVKSFYLGGFLITAVEAGVVEADALGTLEVDTVEAQKLIIGGKEFPINIWTKETEKIIANLVEERNITQTLLAAERIKSAALVNEAAAATAATDAAPFVTITAATTIIAIIATITAAATVRRCACRRLCSKLYCLLLFELVNARLVFFLHVQSTLELHALPFHNSLLCPIYISAHSHVIQDSLQMRQSRPVNLFGVVFCHATSVLHLLNSNLSANIQVVQQRRVDRNRIGPCVHRMDPSGRNYQCLPSVHLHFEAVVYQVPEKNLLVIRRQKPLLVLEQILSRGRDKVKPSLARMRMKPAGTARGSNFKVGICTARSHVAKNVLGRRFDGWRFYSQSGGTQRR